MTLNELLALLPYRENWNPRVYNAFSLLFTENEQQINECLQAAGVEEDFKRKCAEWLSKSVNAIELHPITAAELDEMELPPIDWIVKGLLPIGVGILAAQPKSYKSFMALQLCIAVCQGSEFLGMECARVSCLYYELESGKRRPRARMRLMMGDAEKPDNLYFITLGDKVKRIGDGFEQQLREMIDTHPEIRLVVIDVFRKIRKDAKRTDTGYDRDYGDIAPLAELSSQLNICILLIHHTTKRIDIDEFNMISGSIGVLGAVDAAFVLTREKREENEFILHVIGRDVEPQDLTIAFNPSRLLWEYRGTAQEIAENRRVEEYNTNPITETVRKLVNMNNGSWCGTVREIKEAARLIGLVIPDNEQRIGRFISEHEGELWGLDHIRVGSDRKANRRIITFTKTDSIQN